MSKKIKIGLGIVLILGIVAYFFGGKAIFDPNIKGQQDKEIFIPSNATIDDVKNILKENLGV